MLDQLVMGYASQMSGQKAAFVTLNHIQTIDHKGGRAWAACWRSEGSDATVMTFHIARPSIAIAASLSCLVDLGK
ncbi:MULTISPECIES: hypothetical protein [Aeromonas]|uniref:hypothetical protein n=1 Tax=Aeromonas TaxID=642 RepID=UPI001F4B4B20|nr:MULTISPECIES: hypothetical protein [Aeromonas]MCH7370637.1 hypothetical protein [Aeromonas sp. MR16]